MWQQLYDPLGHPVLSALLAALPILCFLLGLTVLRLNGLVAALLALLLAALVAAFGFGMPLAMILGTALLGIANGLWPIGYIVLMAVWLYKLAVASGKFVVIQDSIAAISEDQRVQVLLIAFCFGGFLEGAAGFGVPIAICAALLVQLGFAPVRAAMLCLLANAASGAYGAIGIPTLVGAQQGGVALHDMSLMLIVLLQPLALVVPTLLVAVLDGWRGVRETWPVLLLVGVVFSGMQTVVLYLLGPELVDIIPPLAGMGALALFMRVWKPKRIYREDGAPAAAPARWTLRQVIAAWSPFYLLTATILLWSLPAFKALFAADGALAATVLKWSVPGLHQAVHELPPIAPTERGLAAVWNVALVSAPGTAIALAVLLTTVLSPKLSLGVAGTQLRRALAELWKPLCMICLVMAVAYIANYSGGSSTIGLGLAQSGQVFPLIAPVIGWLGVFITGSVVNNNTLFAHLQAVTATQIGTSPALLVAANTSGGVMGKLISPQSIAIAAAATGKSGAESEIMRSTLGYSVALLAYICLWTFALAQLL